MTPLDRASEYLTRVQSTLREAQKNGDAKLLSAAARMLDEPAFSDLPQHAQDGLLEQYAGALTVVTGGLVG